MNLTFTPKVISSLSVQQLTDVSAQLPVNKNYSWGDLAGWRKLEDLTTIALHHDAYPKANRASYTPMQHMADVANDHINLTRNEPKGDAGFPYHIYIMRGQVYLTNPIAVRTYGVASNNAYTIHVCVHGDYVNYDQLTDADLNCLIAVCLMLKPELPNYQAIKGHGELNPTDCPGYDVGRVRDAVLTTEHRIASGDTWDQKMVKVSELGNQYNYMYNLLKAGEKDGAAVWSMENLLAVHSVLKERGLL